MFDYLIPGLWEGAKYVLPYFFLILAIGFIFAFLKETRIGQIIVLICIAAFFYLKFW